MKSIAPSREGVLSLVSGTLGLSDNCDCAELTRAEIDAQLDDAEIWLSAHIGLLRSVRISVVNGQSDYTMPSDCERVVDIAMPGRGEIIPSPIDLPGYQDYAFGQFWRGGTQGLANNSAYMQVRQQRETLGRVLGTDTDYKWDRSTRRLTIQPAARSGQAIVWYRSTNFCYEEMTLREYHLLRQYALAKVQWALGQIRSKFSEIPAGGARITMNGSELMASAETNISILEEKMKTMNGVVPFIMG